MTQPPNSELDGARVLILEDEFLLADDLARALERVGAEPVGPVNSIERAEKLIGRGRLDAAVVDLNLHGKMSSEFVERLAAMNLPCLVVSGYGKEAVPESIRSLPSLEKPVSAARVIDVLAAELAKAG
jgi:DNA-binding NtrC family response regulator